jgi:hypothetical protein
MLDDRTKALIRALLYPVQFEKLPERGIERVMRLVVFANAMDASSTDYLRAIEKALHSKEKLSEIIPQSHDERTIRNYLQQFMQMLVAASV